MTPRRLLVLGLALWFLILVILLQPHTHRLPVIRHAHPLEPTAPDLPTLAP